MFKLIYLLIKDYGAFGIGIAQLCIICYFGWKLFSNHLKHLEIKVDSLCEGVKDVRVELEKDKNATNKLGNRISRIEGHLEEKDRMIIVKHKKKVKNNGI